MTTIDINGYVHRLKAGAEGQPVFFVFHGTGGDENQFFKLASDLMPAATIVSPRGDVSEYGAARFFRRTGEGVYDMADLARATRKLASFVEETAKSCKALSIIGLGYSNGANILANVLFEQGLFEKAALMHPLIPFKPRDDPGLGGRKVLITAGERDPICPPQMTAALADYFVRQNAELSMQWHSGGHEIRPNEIEAVQAFLA